eukprot:gene9334-14471_t
MEEIRARTVLVTGASGYLGRNVVRELVHRGAEVRAFVRDVLAQKDCVRKLGVVAVVGDAKNAADVAKAAAGCEWAVHCAGLVDLTAGLPRLLEFEAGNVKTTEAALQGCKAAGVAKFVFVSCDAVLVKEHPVHADALLEDEEGVDDGFSGRVLQSPYCITKKDAECLALAANESRAEGQTGMQVVIVRPAMLWGSDDTTWLLALSKACLEGVLRYTDSHRRSTCHVTNCTEGILKALARGGAGEVYHLTDGVPVVFKDFCTEMLLCAGVDPPPARLVPQRVLTIAAAFYEKFYAKPPVSRGLLGLISHQFVINDSKARSAIGYQSAVTVPQGMAQLRAIHKTRARPVWKSDEESLFCENCLAQFTVSNRRHHCRACGGIYCGACTPSKSKMPELSYGVIPQRICVKCNEDASL